MPGHTVPVATLYAPNLGSRRATVGAAPDAPDRQPAGSPCCGARGCVCPVIVVRARTRIRCGVCFLFGDCVLCPRRRHAAAIRSCEFLTFCVCNGFSPANSFQKLPSSDDDQPSLRIGRRANISRWGSAEGFCWPSSSRSPQTVGFPSHDVTTGKSFLSSSLSFARDLTGRARATYRTKSYPFSKRSRVCCTEA